MCLSISMYNAIIKPSPRSAEYDFVFKIVKKHLQFRPVDTNVETDGQLSEIFLPCN